MDDEDCERRRGECLDEMLDLEKQFQELKEKWDEREAKPYWAPPGVNAQ